jgi:hypothetical protein
MTWQQLRQQLRPAPPKCLRVWLALHVPTKFGGGANCASSVEPVKAVVAA